MIIKNNISNYTSWPTYILLILALYEGVFGLFCIFLPTLYFVFFNVPLLNHIILWQFLGGVFLVFGMGYFISFINPIRFWPIIFLGLMFKVIMLILFIVTVLQDYIYMDFLFLVLFNSVIWLLPLCLILKLIYSVKLVYKNFNVPCFEESIHLFKTNKENTLFELSEKHSVLVVFLRHFGCVFCRQLLTVLSENYDYLVKNGVYPVLVYMVDHQTANVLLKPYHLTHAECISDSHMELYRSFGLSRGKLYQLFGLRVLWKTFYLGVVKGYGIGNFFGDVFQMSGIFLLEGKRVSKSFMPEYISDKVDIESFVTSLGDNNG